MVRKVVELAAWLLLGFIVYGTISPISTRPTLPTPSGFEHLAAFAALGMLFCLSYPRRIILVCLIVFGSAVLLEAAQLLTADRHTVVSRMQWKRWREAPAASWPARQSCYSPNPTTGSASFSAVVSSLPLDRPPKNDLPKPPVMRIWPAVISGANEWAWTGKNPVTIDPPRDRSAARRPIT